MKRVPVLKERSGGTRLSFSQLKATKATLKMARNIFNGFMIADF
jgi:hypothetical protein